MFSDFALSAGLPCEFQLEYLSLSKKYLRKLTTGMLASVEYFQSSNRESPSPSKKGLFKDLE